MRDLFSIASGARRAGALILASLLFAQSPATAQVSDADRQAARDLYGAGFQLQQAGKYADALDKFQRAQAVFSAPTNLLHIAECQAQLGRLVESAESYRVLTRTPLPAGSPQSFTAAVQQGAAELQQVETRIPKVKIDVSPANVSGLSVSIDDQPMNVALLDVDRPIDPGTHKITAFAPGYTQSTVTVMVREKDPTKPVLLSLQANGGGVVYTQGPVGGPPPGGDTYQQQQSPPPGPPGEPPRYGRERPPPPPSGPTGGFLFGARLGYDVLGGDLAPAASGSAGNNLKVSDVFTNGVGFGLQAGFRFARKGYIGALFEHGFYGVNQTSSGFPNGTSVTASGNMVGAEIGYISNPEGVGVILDVGVGYRWLGVSATDTTGAKLDTTYSGGEFLLGGGIWIKAGNSLRIVPRLDLGIGSFSNSTTLTDLSGATQTNSTPGSVTHAIAFFGVSGDFNIDFGKKPPPQPE